MKCHYIEYNAGQSLIIPNKEIIIFCYIIDEFFIKNNLSKDTFIIKDTNDFINKWLNQYKLSDYFHNHSLSDYFLNERKFNYGCAYGTKLREKGHLDILVKGEYWINGKYWSDNTINLKEVL